RRRIRREALVEDSERHREAWIAEIGVEVRELVGGAEGLVRDGAERERGDVRAARALCAPPSAVGAAFRVALRPTQEQLLDPRHRRQPLRPQRVRVDRDPAPLQWDEPLLAARLLDRLARRLVPEEDHRDAEAGSVAGKAGDARPKPLAAAAG